jgi:sialidase-1
MARYWRPANHSIAPPTGSADTGAEVQLDDKTIGLLYETGDFGANEKITFRRIETKELTTAS